MFKNLKDTSHLTFAVITDSQDNLVKEFTNETSGKTLILSSLSCLEKSFNAVDFLLIQIDDIVFYNQTLNYVKDNKFNQKIYLALIHLDAESINNAMNSKIDNFIASPFDTSRFKEDINNDIRNINLLKLLCDMNSSETIIAFASTSYYSQIHPLICKESKAFNAIIDNVITKKECEFILSNLNGSEDIKNNLSATELKLSLSFYFSSFLKYNLEERRNYLSDFTNVMIFDFFQAFAESTILAPLFCKIIKEANNPKIDISNRREFVDLLTIAFKIDKLIVSAEFKNTVQNQVTTKSKLLRNCTLHLLMSSSADKLNNLTNIMHIKDLMTDRLIFELEREVPSQDKISKIVANLKNKGEPFFNFSSFLQKQSKLFVAYGNHAFSNLKINDIVFLFDFVFVNGLKIKHRSISLDLKYSNLIESERIYQIEENILLTSMYAVIENAIEAKATEICIEIVFNEDDKSLLFRISNNGEDIEDIAVNNLFYKHFSTKRSFGLGLNISKRWLNSAGHDLLYNNSLNSFDIQIPFTNKESSHECCNIG